jgi:hypothetical protein
MVLPLREMCGLRRVFGAKREEVRTLHKEL